MYCSIAWSIEKSVTSVLGDIPNLRQLVDVLSKDVGVECYEHLALVTNDDIKQHLKPLPCRLLINTWSKIAGTHRHITFLFG